MSERTFWKSECLFGPELICSKCITLEVRTSSKLHFSSSSSPAETWMCVFVTKCASTCCFSSSCSDSLTQGSDLFALDCPSSLKSVPVGPLYGALIFEGNTPLKALSGTEDWGSHNPLCITKITRMPINCFRTIMPTKKPPKENNNSVSYWMHKQLVGTFSFPSWGSITAFMFSHKYEIVHTRLEWL